MCNASSYNEGSSFMHPLKGLGILLTIFLKATVVRAALFASLTLILMCKGSLPSRALQIYWFGSTYRF